MRKHIYFISALILSFALIFCSITDYYSASNEVRKGVLRLHITANSDSEEDQSVKLKVRDALLEEGSEIFDGSVNADEAEEKITPQLKELEETADRVLAENGFDYKSSAYITEEYFDTREYDGVTLPAGRYKAIRVALGTGEGKNWWCVMFPPLCLPAVTSKTDDEAFAVFENDGENIVKAEGGYAVRFKIVEKIENVINYFKSKK